MDLWADEQNFKEKWNWGVLSSFLVFFKKQEEKWGIIAKNKICLQEHRACKCLTLRVYFSDLKGRGDAVVWAAPPESNILSVRIV